MDFVFIALAFVIGVAAGAIGIPVASTLLKKHKATKAVSNAKALVAAQAAAAKALADAQALIAAQPPAPVPPVKAS